MLETFVKLEQGIGKENIFKYISFPFNMVNVMNIPLFVTKGEGVILAVTSNAF